MGLLKKITSFILCAIIIITIIVSSVISSFAVTTFREGDYEYAINDGKSFLLYKYYGDDTSITLPDAVEGTKVTGIYDHCFLNSSLISITIPESYKTIGEGAFLNSAALSSVNILGSLTSIGRMSFSGCVSLTEINLEGSVLSEIPYAAFMGDTLLETVNLCEGIETIGEYAFCRCGALFGITLPDSLKTIRNKAFYNNVALSTVYLGARLKSIGEEVFSPMAENGDIELVCNEGTYASQYLQQNGYEGIVVIPKGDFNLDGRFNINDATSIQKYIANLHQVLPQALEAGDVNKDGKISVRDATLIQMRLAEIISSFD